MTPIFVETHWSEAGGELDQHKVWAFDEFEAKAKSVAMAHKTGGYLKTNVTVLFDNGSRIQMRLDLAENDTHGIRDHVEGYRKFLATPRGKEYRESAMQGESGFLDAMLAVQFQDEQKAAA